MRPFKGAIFDLDGTLLDSLGVWEYIDIAFLGKRGIEVPPDYVEKVTPLSFVQAAEYTIARFKLNEHAQDIISEWTQMTQDAYANSILLKPFAREYLDRLKAQGVRLAVATALSPALYEPALRSNDIFHYFDVFANLGEVNRDKSFPDIYLLAAERLNLNPEDCVVFEDICDGIMGAKSGGFITCGVYDRYSEYERDKMIACADKYVMGFEELLR